MVIGTQYKTQIKPIYTKLNYDIHYEYNSQLINAH